MVLQLHLGGGGDRGQGGSCHVAKVGMVLQLLPGWEGAGGADLGQGDEGGAP